MTRHVPKSVVITSIVIAMVVVAVLPWVWGWNTAAGVVCLVAMFAWVVWIVSVYMRWGQELDRDDGGDGK